MKSSTPQWVRWFNVALILSLLLPPPAVFAASIPSSSASPPQTESPVVGSSATSQPDEISTTGARADLEPLRSPKVYLPLTPIKRIDRSKSTEDAWSTLTAASVSSSPADSVGDVMYVANSKQIGRTRNFLSESPTWVSITGEITGTIYDFVLDPFDPYNQAFAVGTTGVWKTSNLDAETPDWTNILSKAYISETLPHDKWEPASAWSNNLPHGVSRILPSLNRPGYFLILVTDSDAVDGIPCDNDEGAWTGRTFDYGANWQWSQLPADRYCGNPWHLGLHSKLRPGAALDMADDGSGRIWLAGEYGSNRPRVHYSSDWGATWSYIWGTDTDWSEARNLYVPDSSPGVIYMNQGISLTQSSNGGSSWVDITPSGAEAGSRLGSIAGVPLEPDVLFFTSRNSVIVGTVYSETVYRSNDSGASFPVTFTLPGNDQPGGFSPAPNSIVVPLSASDPDMLASLAFPACDAEGSNGTCDMEIAFSDDGGLTWSSRIGDWEDEDVFGSWAGGSGTSAEYGGVFIQNPKKIEEAVALLDRMVRTPACPPCSAYTSRNHAGGPIDTLSGNYTYQKIDQTVPVLGGALALQRSYSADTRDLFTDTLGYGWTHSHIIRLVFPGDPGGEAGQVLLRTPGGSELPFFNTGGDTYKPYFGVTAQMSQITATGGITTYVVTATNQMVYTFNASGLVTQTLSPAGHVITYTYFPTGPLQSVQSYGRSLDFFDDAQDRLTRVTDPIDRSTRFGYDVNGDLAVVTDTRGLTWTYQYSGTTRLLTDVIDPDGRTVERTEFDGQGRALRQYNGNDELVVELEYGPSGTITVTDGLENSSVDRYVRGTWLGGLDAASQPLTRTYDANFKPTLVADQNGHGTQLSWDDGGSNLEQVIDASGFTTTLSYDALNNLTQTVDARGFTTTYAYSGTLLISQTDALTNTWIYTYGLDNLLVAQQDPLERVTRYQYNAFGQRTVVTDALENVTRYEYDGIGRLITTTEPSTGSGQAGRITVNAYDAADQLIAVTANYTSTSAEPNYLNTYNRITRYAYDGFGRQVLVTDTLGRVTRNGYDDAGRLVSVTVNYSPTLGPRAFNQYNLITRYGYDAVGDQVLVTDTLGFVTRTEYDALNRPVTVTTNYQDGVFDPTRPDEDILRLTGYDPAGNAVTQTDPSTGSGQAGRVTRTWYDELNRPISVTVNYSPTLSQNYNGEYNLVTRYAYDEVGNTTEVTDTLGRVTRNYYDPLGRVISTTINYSPTLGTNFLNQYNLTTRYEYDAVGNRVVMTDPLTGTTRYAYDALNRVITMTDALSGASVTVYDAIGNRVKTIDALSHTTVYTYDAANRLAASTDAAGQTTQYLYDALGNTRVVTDAGGNPTTTAYDTLNRVITTTNALSGTTVFGYDALSRRTVITDANGQAMRTEHDGVGRPITTTDALDNRTVVAYDALGNRVRMTDGLGHTTVYTYNTANRLVAQADALGNTTQYVYDALGNRAVMTDANNIATQYGYDTLSRLISVTENYSTTGLSDYQTNLTTYYGYDAVSNRTVITNARGYTTTYTYDALYRMLSERDPLGNTTRYAYDAVGNRTVMTDANAAVITYTYDAVNRMIGTTYPDSSVAYAYDQVGNRTQMTDSLGTTRYTYDALNRLTGVLDPFSQPVTYTYDAVGNRTTLAYPDSKVVTYTYDAANRLATVTNWSSQATTYAYDAANRLITTTLPNGVRSVYVYDAANRLTRLTHTRDGGSETVGDYQFTLDNVGNRISVTETLLSPGGGAGGPGPQLGALPTTADEVVLAVTGHRPPGLSSLRAITETIQATLADSASLTIHALPSSSLAASSFIDNTGLSDSQMWNTTRDDNRTVSDSPVDEGAAAGPSASRPVYLPFPPLQPFEQTTSGYALTLHASRSRVAADGTDAIVLGAAALDDNLQPISDGTPVTWAANLGTVTPISATVEDGVVLARFVGGETPGVATVSVQIGQWSGTARVSVLPVGEMPIMASGRDETGERERLMAQLGTAIKADASGNLGIDTMTYGVAFDQGRVTFTPGERASRDNAATFTYRLESIQVATTSLPLGNLDAPAVTVEDDTVSYDRGSGAVEWYRSRTDGVEQGFTLESLPRLDGDLVIVGSFVTRLRPELVSQREGILFRDPLTERAVFRYGHVVVRDSAGQRALARLALHGRQIIVRIPQPWLAQAVFPLNVDPLLEPIQVSDTSGVQFHPDVAYGSGAQEYLVAWGDWRNDNDDIYAQRTTLTGTLVGSNFGVSTAADTQAYPRVTYGSAPNQYLVVWQDLRDGSTYQVYGQRVSITGTLVGSSFVISTTASAQEYPDVVYNATTAEYLASWQEDDLIYARRVLSDGTPAGSGILISNENGQPPSSGLAERPALAYNDDDQNYLVTWTDTRNDPGEVLGDIFVQRLSITGTLLGTNTAVISRSLDEFHPAVAYNAVTREYLVAAVGGAYDSILAQRVSNLGVSVGDVITVTTPTLESGAFQRPAVAAESDGDYALVWADQDRTGLQRMSSSGRLVGSVLVLDDDLWTEDVSMAYGVDDNSHLVAWIALGTAFARLFRPVDADFSASPVEGSAPLTVTFTNQSTPADDITSYLWNFGDGFTSTITNPVHTYTQTGNYTVTLNAAAGAEDETITRTNYITVTSGGAAPSLITTTITYTYDPLYRLTGADYSGAYTYTFGYAYDQVGNRTVQTRTITSSVVTTYTYDAASRLTTAKASDDPNLWYYTSNANGNLIEVTPNGTSPANGALRYTYDPANRLTSVERHDGSAYQPQASMVYDGAGQRLRITAWQGGLSITSTYVVDFLAEGTVLAATANSQTTYYLYGYGVIAEQTSTWAFYLKDGQATVRQLSDATGAVTLLRSYDPFGQVLSQAGTGNLAWGYFGGLLDAATGLIYLGDGLYYDPVTGRFLTPGGTGRNPYVPTSRADPLGAMLGSVALLALIGRRRRMKDKNDYWLVMLIVLVGVSTGLAACQMPTPGPSPTPQPPTTPPIGPMPTPEPPPPDTGDTPPPPTPTPQPPTPTPDCPTPSPTPQWLEGEFTITLYPFALERDPIYANDQRVTANGLPPIVCTERASCLALEVSWNRAPVWQRTGTI